MANMTGGDDEATPQGTIETEAGMVRENDDGSVDVDIGIEMGDVVEHEDGSAEVTIDEGEEEDAEVANFYENLVPTLVATNRKFLDDISIDFIDLVEEDIKARAPRDEKYAEGIKRTGFANDAPGGAQFLGASRVAHPMLAQSAVDYEARAIKEIFPANGPAKSHIVGTVTKRRQEKAVRVARCMNWQMTTQMTEFRPGLERGLMQSSLNGDSYIHWIPRDPILKRQSTQVVNADKVVIAAEATEFYSAERITILDDITQMVYESRIDAGMYWVDPEMPIPKAPSQAPDKTKAEEAREKVEGKTETTRNDDGVRRIYVINTFLRDVEKELGNEDTGEFLPYLLYIDDETYKVVGLVRNWEEDDAKRQRMHWLTNLPFIPWEESSIGLVHLIGGLSAAATGALRALLDSAHVNNIPTAVMLKGSGVSGQSKTLSPTQVFEIEGGIGADDVRKVMMQMPYNEPSTVLMALMEFLVGASEGVVRTTFEKLSENNTNLPVGTTYALIEQGLTVVSSIMARLHFAMQQGFSVLYRINRMYLDDQEIKNEAGEVLAYRSDFNGSMDVVPVSDPNIPSDSHRFAQTQALVARSDAKPELYNARAVEMKVLEQLRFADPERFLAPKQAAVEMNAANENMAATLGRPVMAFPEQDHYSHIKTHIEYMQSPMFGFLSIIAPTYLPVMLDHLKEHLALYYVSKIFEGLQTSIAASKGQLESLEVGTDVLEFMKMGDPGINDEMDKLIAEVSTDVVDPQGPDMMALIKLQVPEAIAQAQKVLEMYRPPQPSDPAQAQIQKAQIASQDKAQDRAQQKELKVIEIQGKRQEAQQKLQATVQDGEATRQATSQQIAIKEAGDDRRTAVKEEGDNARTEAQIAADLQMNSDDNRTAMLLGAAEIESGEKVARSTGGDSSPGA